MAAKKKTLSIVIPVYNEEKNIPELVKRLTRFTGGFKKYGFEFIFVEHGSADRSFELLAQYAKKDKRIKVLQLSRNFGCDGGIAAGLHFAHGDAAVIMMADLQEPLELVRDFAQKWEEGFEIVYGIVRKRTGSFARNFCSRLFYKILNILTKNMFPENASDFRLIDKKVYSVVNNMPEQNKYLRGLIMWLGFTHTGILFNRQIRFAGENKSDFFTVFRVARNGIFSFSYLPLQFASIIGVSLTVISFIMILFYLSLYFIRGREAPGVATIIVIMLFLFGMLFFILGIISEYLARIYDEVKRRPNFIVRSKINL